jgi:Na+-transporting NADH:ubiquinone oxidoreductase subunit A
MPKDITIKKGLTIRLKGEAQKTLSTAPRSRTFVIKPSDFHLVIPKMVVKEGEKLQAGDVIFYSKKNEAIKFVSPVSGTLTKIERGEKRKILALHIDADSQDNYKDFGVKNPLDLSSEEIKSHLLTSGCWPFIKQRPYDVIANTDTTPKSIFVSAYNTAPIAADYDFVLNGKEKELQTAINALQKLTSGNIHVSVGKNSNSVFSSLKNIELHSVSGPHPAGNVGTQINKIDPINKGETVWTITPQDLVIIGNLFLTGTFNAERTIALSGCSVKNPKYYTTKIGAEVATFIYDSGLVDENVRVISGNVLTGKTITPKGHLDFYSNTVSVIPEGNDYEFFGWAKPVFNKLSITRALTFSWLFPKKEMCLTTTTNGEHRAFVMTGLYEQVFPLDIYPLQLLKSCLYKDLDEMEALGMYEVAPEDFALTEVVCISKQPHQKIIREGLDLMYKEIG